MNFVILKKMMKLACLYRTVRSRAKLKCIILNLLYHGTFAVIFSKRTSTFLIIGFSKSFENKNVLIKYLIYLVWIKGCG